MLRALLLTFTVAGLFAYVPSVVLALRLGYSGVVVVDTVIYAAVLLAFFLPRLSFWMRALVMLAVVYVLGAFLLVVLGPFGSGALWLFSLPVLAGALLGLRAAVATLALNLLTLLVLYAAGSAAVMAGTGWVLFPRGSLPVLIVNFLLLDTAAAVSVAMLVRRLEQALAEEHATRTALDVERRELVALNELVSREMEGLLVSERARVVLEDQLRQAQKMEAIGRLAGGVAHDFNNLLTAILGHVSLALRGRDDPARLRRRLQEIERAAERAAGLTHQLLAFSRKQVLQPRLMDLNQAVRELEEMLRPLIGEDVELVVRMAPQPLTVRADPTQLHQVVMNLAVNARDAMPRGGRLTIETAAVEDSDAAPGPAVSLTVSDTGIGMDEATRLRAFDPFFTTKPVGQGTGLGLATVYGIVAQSEGTVTLNSEPGRGATFRILLPAAAEPVQAVPSALAPSEGGAETILLVEDEDLLRTLAGEVLTDLGYTVLEAASGPAALRISRETAAIHLVLTDVVMSGMGGREVWTEVSRHHPEALVLFMSGYTDDATVRHGVLAAEVAFLNKPFTLDELARRVRALLDERPAAAASSPGRPLEA